MSGWLLAIDFGTSFTTAAVRRDGGTPEILRFQGQDDPQRLPSLVLVDEDGRLRVGEDAWAEAALHPGRLLRAPKSHLGEREPYRLEARRVAPVEAVAAVLRAVWEEALKQHGGDEPGEVRLSHPASWARERKTALADAARAAGMEAVTLAPPEPVAAAVQCAGESTREGKQRVPVGGYAAVYDLGGGTFDAAVVRRTGEDSFEVVGEPRGVDDLGGELFDQRLQERLRQTLAHQSEEASATLTDSVRLRHEFLSKVRHAKERLARSPSASFAVHGLPDFHVTREEFDGLIRAYIEESAGILEATVREALRGRGRAVGRLSGRRLEPDPARGGHTQGEGALRRQGGRRARRPEVRGRPRRGALRPAGRARAGRAAGSGRSPRPSAPLARRRPAGRRATVASARRSTRRADDP
jgi:molecular chaperone DnaK (HSP70)